MSKFDWAGFLIFGLVFVSRDFEVGAVRPLRRVDHQSPYGANLKNTTIDYILMYLCSET